MPLNAGEVRRSTERAAVNAGETTASEGEATSNMPPATDTSPSSTSVATVAGAGRAAEASETVIASRRNGGRSSSAAAGTLTVLLLFRVAIVGELLFWCLTQCVLVGWATTALVNCRYTQAALPDINKHEL